MLLSVRGDVHEPVTTNLLGPSVHKVCRPVILLFDGGGDGRWSGRSAVAPAGGGRSGERKSADRGAALAGRSGHPVDWGSTGSWRPRWSAIRTAMSGKVCPRRSAAARA